MQIILQGSRDAVNFIFFFYSVFFFFIHSSMCKTLVKNLFLKVALLPGNFRQIYFFAEVVVCWAFNIPIRNKRKRRRETKKYKKRIIKKKIGEKNCLVIFRVGFSWLIKFILQCYSRFIIDTLLIHFRILFFLCIYLFLALLNIYLFSSFH